MHRRAFSSIHEIDQLVSEDKVHLANGYHNNDNVHKSSSQPQTQKKNGKVCKVDDVNVFVVKGRFYGVSY